MEKFSTTEAEHPPSRQLTPCAPPQELESDAQLFLLHGSSSTWERGRKLSSDRTVYSTRSPYAQQTYHQQPPTTTTDLAATKTETEAGRAGAGHTNASRELSGLGDQHVSQQQQQQQQPGISAATPNTSQTRPLWPSVWVISLAARSRRQRHPASRMQSSVDCRFHFPEREKKWRRA